MSKPKEQSTFDRIKKILSEPQFLLEEQDITLNAELVADFNLNFEDVVEMAVLLEKEFGVELSDEEWMGAATVSDLVKLMEKPKAQAAKA